MEGEWTGATFCPSSTLGKEQLHDRAGPLIVIVHFLAGERKPIEHGDQGQELTQSKDRMIESK